MTTLNSQPRSTLQVDCMMCRGRGCELCEHTGNVTKSACRRCGGTGSDVGVKDVGKKCLDCRGDGWRDIDNVKHWD